jgi:WD40 repeat protein
MHHRLPALPVLAFFLAACATTGPALQPNVILERTQQDGGSALGVDPASTRVVGGGWDGTVQVWQLADGRELARWRAHQGTVHGAVFVGPDRILTASFDGGIAIWDPKGNRIASQGAGSPVTAFDITPDLRTFVTGHADGYIRWWQTEGLKPLGQMPVHDGVEVLAVALDPNGTMAASSDDDGRVALVTPDGKHRWLDRPPTDALTLVFAREGGTLYGAGWFKLFRWDSAGDQVKVLATDHRGQIKRLAFTPDGRELASISRQTDSAVLLLDPATGRTLSEVGKHDLCGGVVMLSPDGRYLVSTSDDATVRVWDRRNPRYGQPPAATAKPQAAPGVF